ncbi:MAG: phosphoribosyltransferase [Acaryochloridaceae cyanobacterium RU_4_10]|nr:phosphoribosyltransferase [Acaryochloridaceae cyanobacterium RU_4_10]
MNPDAPFHNRAEAGRLLAQALQQYAHYPQVIVLGLPRGGIPVAYEIATVLGVPLDAYLVRKLGVPHHTELAMGAISSEGLRHLNARIIQECDIDPETLERVTQQEWKELQRRDLRYREGRPSPSLEGQIIILVDDGIATGATMLAALESLQQHRPQKIVVAVPVGPVETIQALNQLADEVVCLITPTPFNAVGEWYADFSQTSDEEVCHLLGAGNV